MAFSEEQLERYSRHFVLSELGVAGQQKLLHSRVLVIGSLAVSGCRRCGVSGHCRL